MNFEQTPIQQEIRELARRFATKELAPIIEDDEKHERFRPEVIQALGDVGLAGIATPEAYGGAGMGYLENCVAIEEIARISAGYAVSIAVTGLTQVILNGSASAEQKKKYIPPLTSGKAIGAFSLSEAGSGSDAASLKTTAKRDGKHYVINGTKLWTTQGDSADTIILMARTGGQGAKGVSSFIIEKGMKGFSLGKREKKMGCAVSHTMELIFEDCRVPAENLLGKEGEGFKVALTGLNSGRITIAAVAAGVASAALELATKHACLREQFGKPIIELQGISFMLADMAVQLDAAKLLIQRAAWLKDNNKPMAAEAAMAKLFATDTAMKITTDAVQILGGSGYTQDFPAERYMREAKVLQIVEGTNQIQRVVIGKAIASAHP